MTRDIPRSEWRQALDVFSRQHAGWIVRVSVRGPDGLVRIEARDLPLQGVSADAPGAERVAIMVGASPDDHVTHEVTGPIALTIEENGEGAARGLRIEAADGSTTRLDVRAPLPPEEGAGVPR
jgi:hypothetical protein